MDNIINYKDCIEKYKNEISDIESKYGYYGLPTGVKEKYRKKIFYLDVLSYWLATDWFNKSMEMYFNGELISIDELEENFDSLF